MICTTTGEWQHDFQQDRIHLCISIIHLYIPIVPEFVVPDLSVRKIKIYFVSSRWKRHGMEMKGNIKHIFPCGNAALQTWTRNAAHSSPPWHIPRCTHHNQPHLKHLKHLLIKGRTSHAVHCSSIARQRISATSNQHYRREKASLNLRWVGQGNGAYVTSEYLSSRRSTIRKEFASDQCT